ncbi:MAG: HEAT repeat domain-containing protein, partial [Chloroflexota bacterium]|nr:HEAT repeat domain-containing protein [Chloroflexota bacterium]
MTLERYLPELKDLSQPLRISKLTNLSRLADEEGRLFAQTWPAVEAKRRREVVGHLVELAEDNLTLDFDPVLSLCLKDPDPEVRGHALAGLAQSEDPSLIGPLIRGLQSDPAEKVRAAAASALAHFVLLAELGKLRASDAARLESTLSALLRDSTQPLEVHRRALEAISPLS